MEMSEAPSAWLTDDEHDDDYDDSSILPHMFIPFE